MKQQPRVCLIGAGSSGIPCVKALADAELAFDCFEASNEVGGNWCIRNRNGMSSAYDSLHINTSRQKMQYADYPMPEDYPDFPGHRWLKRYFDNYVDHFQLRQKITFDTRVVNAKPSADGWQIELDSGERREYDALVVANGHHWDPRWPEPDFPGQFDGHKLHSHDYLNPHDPVDFNGQRVLLIGSGNSAMDIACELARPGLTEQVVVSSRSPTWVIPRYLFGRPLDQLPLPPRWLPWRMRSAVAASLLRLLVGTPDRYGAPRPSHPLLASHPTISSEFLDKLGSGDLSWRPTIRRFDGRTVEFDDDARQEFDSIIYCTGYNISFPFFNSSIVQANDNDLPLWLRMMQPTRRNLFFIGLLQPLGAVMPLAEQQAKLIGAFLSGQIDLPDANSMNTAMERERTAMFKRYRQSARHTMQVDFDEYQHQIRRVMRKGQRLAQQ